jgi:hypothetical protein
VIAAVVVALAAVPTRASQVQEVLLMKKLTPVIFVEEIEPCLDSWEGRLGFYGAREIVVRSPCGTVVGFAEMSGAGN